MANSSPINSTPTQLAAIERLGWDFYSFFRVEYPEKNKTQIRRVRKSYGRREYVCLHCSTRWSNGYTGNATTPHRHAMLAVCAQWVDHNYALRKALLGLPECPFSHSGEAQAALIVEVLRNFDILRVGYHTANWILSGTEWVDFNPKRRRIRCIGHIINLSSQSFPLARAKETHTAALNATISDESVDMIDYFATTLAETISQQEEPVLQGKRLKSTAKASQKTGISEGYTGWQGIPALQKLHNLAVWLRSSSLHSHSWRDAVGLSHGIDNATRWSSWYKVIDNATRKKVQINQFLLEHDREFEDTVLSGSDWDLLAKTHAFLEPFASGTLYAEGKCSSASQFLFVMDALLFHYESAKVQHSQPGPTDTRILHAIDMGWFVLDKYYPIGCHKPPFRTSPHITPVIVTVPVGNPKTPLTLHS
ncbi:hypothetical protein BFJ70_g17554 [Fusarium oxysporum]|nr:hypothetical protein BFJ70_g17554 [Fusarium oxysporum]